MNILSPSQREIINHIEGPSLVLAGPGSGKTTVITKRLAFLASFTDARRLLSITFTRAAAREMEERYKRDMSSLNMPHFSTIHSLANIIIKDYEEAKGIRIKRIEGKLKDDLLKEAWQRVNPELDMPDLSKYKMDERQVANIKEVYLEYEKMKKERNYIDFDDMISLAKEIISGGGSIALKWQEKFDYIQVDEGQDLSKDQFEFIKLLAINENLLVVADDDQSIYGFRGADPSLVLSFKDHYEKAKIFYLEENYRSCLRIVALANSIIKRNELRYDKDIYTNKLEKGEIYFKVFLDLNSQATYVVKKALKLLKAGRSVAILYRNNISALLFEAYCGYYKIGYSLLGEEVNLSIDDFLSELEREERDSSFYIKSPRQIFKFLHKLNFFKEAQDYKFEYIKALAYLYDTSGQIKEAIVRKTGDDKLCLTSIHSAKGLEYDTVFIVDLIQGDFPKREYSAGPNFEEERRLFYVAVTRAKSQLYFTYSQKRGQTYEERSIFYEEARSAFKSISF